MKINNPKNRQTTIMFTDIVGYSKMIEKNEKNALILLEEHNKILKIIIDKYRGHIVKYIGDSIFAEFNKIENCINSALDIQSELKERNNISRSNEKIIIRIGIHTGTVYEKENDLFGNDVNLCSRIESIAPNAGIAASSDAIENYDKKLFSRKIGYVNLKNISHPKLIYKVYINKIDYDSENQNQLIKYQIENGTNIVDVNTFNIKKTISLGLLILNGISKEHSSDLNYILTDQIISYFQKVKKINIPTINETQRYLNSDFSLSDIARKLEVNNLIYGKIINTDKEITLTLNILDSTKGDIVWTNKFIGNINNLGEFCGKILKSILSHFEIELPKKIQKLMSKTLSENPSALKNYFKGINLIERAKNKDFLLRAKNHFSKALKLDENFVESLAQLAITDNKLGNLKDADMNIQKALLNAQNLGNDSSKAMVLNCAGILCKEWNKYDKAIPYFEKALKIQIQLEDQLTEAKILNNLAGCYNYESNPDYAEKLLSKSIKIKERLEDGKSLAYSYAEMGSALLTKGDISNAISFFQKSLGKFSYYEMDYFKCRIFVLLAEVNIDIGDYKETERYLKNAYQISIEINEPLMLGNVFLFQAKLLEINGNIDQAIDSFDKSIEHFQDCELYGSLIQSYIYLGMLYTRNSNYNKAGKCFSKANSTLKRLSSPIIELLIDSNKIYLHSLIGECTIEQCDLFKKKLNKHNHNDELFYQWWLLAKSYYQINSTKKASDCQKHAQSLVKKCSENITNKTHRQAYLTSDLIKLELWKELEKKTIEVKEVSKFCPNCGFSNKDEFKFCPKCGQNLS
tara:strand:- start:1387 stop:3795 length:2409 start_codon:yes stop_codon:yes gene_type:complete